VPDGVISVQVSAPLGVISVYVSVVASVTTSTNIISPNAVFVKFKSADADVIRIAIPSVVCVNSVEKTASTKFTIFISSVVCAKSKLRSALAPPVIKIPAVVFVKLAFNDATPTSSPTPTELEMDAPTAPQTGQQLSSAFGLGDVIQSQSTNTSLTVEAIKSLEGTFRRQMTDLAAAISRI